MIYRFVTEESVYATTCVNTLYVCIMSSLVNYLVGHSTVSRWALTLRQASGVKFGTRNHLASVLIKQSNTPKS